MRCSLLAKAHTAWGSALLLLVLLLLSISAFFLVSGTGAQEGAEPMGKNDPEDNPITTRTQEQINTLKRETLEDSLAHLSFPEMFFWPGTFMEGESWIHELFPLDPKAGQYDVDTILSNRRFLKVFHALAPLPEAKRAKLLSRHMAQALAAQRHTIQIALDQWPALLVANNLTYVDNPVQVTDTGKSTQHGMRLKLLSLMLIAGNLKCKAAFEDVSAVAAEGRRELNVIKARFSDAMALQMVRRDSLYNRQILATALLGTGPDSATARKVAQKYSGRWITKKLTGYDAEYTPYDMFSGRGFIGADYTRP